ncbi:MAG: lytic transglycosylase domain-containing protein, partial [Microbacterium sp.]|nr:lytic transglycosylase domain-containing protein [Microbacterium sp.]
MSVFAVLAVLGFGAAYVGPLTATGTDAHAAELDPVSLYASAIADAQAYLAASE